VQAVADDFGWQVYAGPPEPVVATHDGRLLVVVHPLRIVDGRIVAGIRRPRGPCATGVV